MTPRTWLSERACIAMLACDGVIGLGVLIAKFKQHYPQLEYAQLLATYRFGVVRRALIGQLWSLVNPQTVSASDIYILGTIVLLVTIVMLVLVFRSIFRFSSDTLPLFALIAGSPLSLKNFVYTVGYFDVYGCLAALIALALPLNALYLIVVGTLCIFLLFVHHVHFLLYVPTIGMIALLRHRAEARLDTVHFVALVVVALAVLATFVFLAFFVRPQVSPDVFLDAMRERARDPLDPGVLQLWYSTIGQELQLTLDYMPVNMRRLPIYAVVIALHIPLMTYFAAAIRALEDRVDRLFVLGGLAGITAGYIVICIVIFDYSRWVSSWAVCMMLMMFVVRLLPANAAPPPIAPTPRNAVLAWIITAIPRLGISKPF